MPLASLITAIEPLLPSGLAVGLCWADAAQETLLTAEEKALASRYTGQRLSQFVGGRLAAAKALRRLGITSSGVLADEKGYPIAPQGTVVSLAHSGNLCIAIVGRKEHFRSIGVDIERVERFKPALIRRICALEEIGELSVLPLEEQMRQLSLLFSTKEAFYKYQHPLTGFYLGLRDVAVSLQGDRAEFFPKKEIQCLPSVAYGRCAVIDQQWAFAVVWSSASADH